MTDHKLRNCVINIFCYCYVIRKVDFPKLFIFIISKKIFKNLFFSAYNA